MIGEKGQEKIRETQKKDSLFVPHNLDNGVRKYDLVQAISSATNSTPLNALYFEKQSHDVFTNPAFELFLDLAEVNEVVVYGVATDICVKAAVLGMQYRGIQCYVVGDSTSGVDSNETKKAIDEMKEEGAIFVKTKDVLEDLLK